MDVQRERGRNKYLLLQHFHVILLHKPLQLYTFEKSYYVFYLTTWFVCLSVCVSVSHQDCDEMTGLSNTVLGDAITLDNSSTLQHYQGDPLAGSGSYRSCKQNHILAYNFKTYERIHTKFYLYVVQLRLKHK